MTMKTFFAAATLSLISAVAFAKAAPTAAAPVQYVFQGDSLAPAFTAPLTKSQSRMDYVFMGDTWVPRNVFMSDRSVAEVRAEAARQQRMAAASIGESRH
jgi:hypothetical protein